MRETVVDMKLNRNKQSTLELLAGKVGESKDDVEKALPLLGYNISDRGYLLGENEEGKVKRLKRDVVQDALMDYFSTLDESSPKIVIPLPVSSIGDPHSEQDLCSKEYEITGELIDTQDSEDLNDVLEQSKNLPAIAPPPLLRRSPAPGDKSESLDELKGDKWFLDEIKSPETPEKTDEWATTAVGKSNWGKRILITGTVLASLVGAYVLGNYHGTLVTKNSYDVQVSQLEKSNERNASLLKRNSVKQKSLTKNLEFLNQTNESLFTENLNLLQKYESFDEQLKSVKDKLSTYHSANGDLSSLLDQKENELNKLNQSYDQAGIQLLNLQEQLVDSKFLPLDSDDNSLVEENSFLSYLLEQSQLELSELECDYLTLHERVLGLEETLPELESLKVEKEELSTYITELEDSLAKVTLENNGEAEDNTKLFEQLKVAEESLTKIEASYHALEEEFSLFTEDFVTIQESHNNLTNRYIELEGKLSQSQQLIEMKKVEYDAVNDNYAFELGDNQITIADLSDENNQLKSFNSHLEEDNKQLAELQNQFVVNPYQQIQGILIGPETERSEKLKDLVVNYLKHRTVNKTIVVDGNDCNVALGNLYDTLVGISGDNDKAIRDEFVSYTQRICGNLDPEKCQVELKLKK